MSTRPNNSHEFKLPEGGHITVSLELVTPAAARAMLAANQKNRKQRQRQVQIIARALTAGEWVLTHQGVAFGEDGILIDGQHRLEAIAASGVAALLFVFRGLPRQRVQEAVDQNAARSVAENLMLTDGLTYANNVMTYLNAMARVWLGYDFRLSVPQARGMLRLLPVSQLVAKEDFTHKVAPAFRMSPVLAAFVVALETKKTDEKKKVADLFDRWRKGLGIASAESPAAVLRDYCVRRYNAGSFDQKARQEAFSMAADMIMAAVDGRAVKDTKGAGLKWLQDRRSGLHASLKEILKAK